MIVNHPVLATLAAKARQARDVAASSSKVDKELSSEIKVIMGDLDSKEVIVGDLKVSLSETSRENSKLFNEALETRTFLQSVLRSVSNLVLAFDEKGSYMVSNHSIENCHH